MNWNEKWTIRLLALLILLPLPLAAQDHPAVERGFAADKVYQLADLDNVNLLNGAASVRIPIGGAYKAGGSLSYALTLVYTSKSWDFEEILTAPATYQVRSLPARHAAAGFGWTLSLGELIPPNDPSNETGRWQYLDGSLGRHGLYPTLHPGDTADTGVSYTRDSTYLRMKEIAGGNRTLEFPDGQIHTFNSAGQITRIEDRFGNYLDVAYTTNTWSLTDGQGRTHTVTFTPMTSDGGQVNVVTKVELEAFGGATATYNFSYTSTQIEPACTDTYRSAGATITVPLLNEVSLPDGSSFVPTYHETGCVSGLLKSLTLPTLGKIEYDWGTWRLPTEGCSDNYMLPWAARTEGVGTRRFVDPSGTVLGSWNYSQQLLDPPTPPTGLCTGESEDPSEVSVTTVTTPLGHYTKYYFSVWPNLVPVSGSPNGFLVREYGLPFDRTQPDASGTRYLSSESYDCSPTCAKKRSTYVRYEYERPCVTNSAQICDESNRRLVSRRTVYHDDGGKYADETFSDFDGLSHYRSSATAGSFPSGNVRTATTEYNPGHDLELDASFNVQTGYTMWSKDDAWVLGTFTEQTTSEGGVTAKTQTCFDGATGFLKGSRVLKGGSPGTADVVTWLKDDDSDGSPDIELHYGGDAQAVGTSGLCGLSLPAEPAYRKVHSYASGVLESSRYTNPDGSGTGINFKNVDLTIDASTGLPSASRDVSLITTDFEYDALGRLTWEKPEADHGAWIEYQYTPATSATAPAKVRIRRRANGSKTGTILAQEEYQFDGFGRVAQERRLLPGLDWVARDTTYDAMGHTSTVSQWYDEDNPPGTLATTKYLSYDAFGRPGKIRPPDGGTHDVTMSYTGDRVVNRTVKIATSTGPEENAVTTERYDRQGRLYQVVEPSGVSGGDVTTTYSYDVGNRLSGVSTTVGSITQIRTFTYDKRGFLTAEAHPEKTGAVTYSGYDALGHVGRKVDGPSDLTFVYDAAERLTQIRETGGDTWKSFSYAASNGTNDRRLGKLQTATRYNRYDVLMEIPPAPDEIFSSGFECGDTSGWNDTPLSCSLGTEVHYDVAVAETYTYGGKAGRASQRDTEITLNGSGGTTFTQGFTYTDVGDVASLTYPNCNFSRCTDDGAGTARTVSFTYTRALLTSVPGYTDATGFDYHPNGLLSHVYHKNAADLVQEIAANGMARPSQISAVLGTNTLWKTGTYTYDGAGNVKSIGGSSFAYDKVSRLISADVSRGLQGTGSLVSQDYTFDAFGNLTSIAGTNGRTIPTNSATNRLSGSVSYDNAGNLLTWNGNGYEYDPLHMMRRLTTPGGEDWLYVYTADDERIWMYDLVRGTNRYALRDLSGKVLREYTVANDYWTLERDYIYNNGQLFAAETPEGLRHFYPDHLGTPRLVTNSTGGQVAYHVYYPYGEEATDPNQDQERMKFTGHERDLADPSGTGDDLDYMHARFCSPLTGRFLTLDSNLGERRNPQTWNRYTYVRNSPVILTDPTGRNVRLSVLEEDERNTLIEQLREETGLDLYYDENSGDLESRGELVDSDGKPLGSSTARGDLLLAINSAQVYWGLSRNGSASVNIARRRGPYIELDFQDISQIETGENDPATFNAGMIFLHELQHIQGRPDPADIQLKQVPSMRGAAVNRMNVVRRELGLPIRKQFLNVRSPEGRYFLPFENGPVYLPDP